MSLIRERRSVRKFLPEAVAPELVTQLAEAALRAPSSRGFNPWEFIVVTAPDVLDKLSRAKPHGAAFLKNAPLGIVVCADPDKSDVWVEDASIAAIYLHLAAASLGLGSCWVQMRKRMHDASKTAEAYISDLLGIPDRLRVLAVMAIGRPDQKTSPHGADYPQVEKVHAGRYGTPWQGSLGG
jgi:nitroreductase